VLARAVGWWLILSTVSLQSTHNQLTVARQIERGGPGVRRRVLGVIVLVVGALGYSLWQQARPAADGDLRGFNEMAAYVTRLLDSGLAHWFLLPFKVGRRPFAAGSLRDFALGHRPGGGYSPALRLRHRAIGSVLAPKARSPRPTPHAGAQRLAGGQLPDPRQNEGDPRAIRPARSRTAGNGVFLEKPHRDPGWFNLRVLLRVLGRLGSDRRPHCKPTRQHSRPSRPLVLAGAAVVTFYTLLAGPQLFRQDLRSDLANADILKTYPLAGWQSSSEKSSPPPRALGRPLADPAGGGLGRG